MADLTVTAANVTSNNTSQTYRSYETDVAITAGEAVAEDPSTGNLVLAKADTENNAQLVGIALTTSSGAGEYIVVAERGLYVSGASMVAGTYYVVSGNAGKLAPFGDLTTGEYVTYAVVAESTSTARILPYSTAITVA